MAIKGVNSKLLPLGIVAALLAALTLYDYTVGLGNEGSEPDPAQQRLLPGGEPGKVASLVDEVSELRFLLARAPEVRTRYQKIAIPYAESVATFATFYATGETPAAAAKRQLAGLLQAPVKIGEVLISEADAGNRGAVMLNANLDFSSHDSAAFTKALLALSDASNGMVWKELSVTADPGQHELRASGQLTLLMVEQVE